MDFIPGVSDTKCLLTFIIVLLAFNISIVGMKWWALKRGEEQHTEWAIDTHARNTEIENIQESTALSGWHMQAACLFTSSQLSRELQICHTKLVKFNICVSLRDYFIFHVNIVCWFQRRGMPVYSGHCAYGTWFIKYVFFVLYTDPLKG